MCMENYKYFKENLEALYSQYPERYLLIKDEGVVGDFDTFDLAYQFGISKYEEGAFIIQHCCKQEGSIYFASLNVAFAGT